MLQVLQCLSLSAAFLCTKATLRHPCSHLRCRLLPYPVASLSFCRASQQVALGGGSAVGILAWEGPGRGAREVESDWAELDGGQQVAQVQWSPDGQLLTVATKVCMHVSCVCCGKRGSSCALIESCSRPPASRGRPV